MKKDYFNEHLFEKTNSKDFATFASDCLYGIIKMKGTKACGIKSACDGENCTNNDKNIITSKAQVVLYQDYDKWYQTKDDTLNCKVLSRINDKNSVDIIIRRGKKVVEEGVQELKIIHGKVAVVDASIYGTEMYMIHMIPGKDGNPTKIETKHYKDISPIFDSYLRLSIMQEKTFLNNEPNIKLVNIKIARYWFEECLTQNFVHCYKELIKFGVSPDEVRTNTVKPGEEALAINKIFKDPWLVIRRFEQIEQSKKEKEEYLKEDILDKELSSQQRKLVPDKQK